MQHFTQQKHFALQLFTYCFTILPSVFINIISDLNLKTTTFFWQAKIISVFINLGAFKLLWPRFSVYQRVMPARTRTWHCMVGTEHQSYTCVFQIRLHGITEVPQRLEAGQYKEKLLVFEQTHFHLFYIIGFSEYSLFEERIRLFVFKFENTQPTTC